MDYQKEFSKLIAGEVTISSFALSIAAFYQDYNLKMVAALRAFREVRKVYSGQVDEATGKPISAVKADVLADATEEAHSYELARAHVNNIEMMMKALSFQNAN